MVKLCFGLAVVIAASIGSIAGSDHARRQTASAHDDRSRSEALRANVEQLRARLRDVKRDLDAAQTPAAEVAAQAMLFQLRVDLVAVEDELAVLARRKPAARDL